MADKWEVVGGGKKKKVGNGQVRPQPVHQQQPVATIPGLSAPKINGKAGKKSRKVIMDYKIQTKQGGEVFQIPEPTPGVNAAQQQHSSAANKPKKPKPKVQHARKGGDLESVLERVPVGELNTFFEELALAGTTNDSILSWIKYSAGALHSKLNHIQYHDVPQWPNDITYPSIPSSLENTIRTIISKTVNSIHDHNIDVLGLSFSSLLATVPNICQRGDPGWGYLIMLREIIRMDPDILLRRARSYSDIMESYENRKEIGTALLWVSAQACLYSSSVLRIVMNQLVPFYNFKHYKTFVVSVLNTLGDTDEMASDIIIEPEEFEEFFEFSFDPKKRKDFEKFYPRIKVSAQACLYSSSVLRIVMNQLVPFYNFKHYKTFVVSVLNTLGDTDEMASDIIIEPEEFEEFFEFSFDPKKRKDFEKFYPRIKELTLKNLRGRGSELFTSFLVRLGDKDFAPFSVYGHETFDILHGCLDNDPTLIPYWLELLPQYPKESGALLNYLSKVAGNLSSYKLLEYQLIQTDKFAVASVKNPELLRAAKKLQVGFQRVEASRKRSSSWKMAIFVVLLSIIGLLYLDTMENGKGTFAKSNVGKFLASYGLLDEVVYVADTSVKLCKTGYAYVQPLFRSIYETLRPLLQALEKQIEIYIPQVVQYTNSISKQTVVYFNYLTEKVFVGSLSPENLRKLTKEVLSFVWTNIYMISTKGYELLSLLVQYVKQFV